MAVEYNKMNNYRTNAMGKDTKLEVEPHVNHMQDFVIDARALMQAKHDPSAVFLNRLFSSWEFRFFYLFSSLLAIAGIIYCSITEGKLIVLLNN